MDAITSIETWSTKTPRARSHPTNSSLTVINSSGTISRRHSSPALVEVNSGTPVLSVYVPSRKRSSIATMPPTPIIQPNRLPSIAEPARSSWRLSFTSDHRGDHLRKLSQEHSIPTTTITENVGPSPPPMRRWLHSQGLRSSSNVIASSDDNTNLDSHASHSQTCSTTQDFGGVDGPEEGENAFHLYEMGISQRLASRGLQSSSSSPQLSSWGSHQRGISSISASSQAQVLRTERARYLWMDTSESIPLSERMPEAWGAVVRDGTLARDGASSFYPSAGNSIQPSPQSSRFNLQTLLESNRNMDSVIDPKGKRTFHNYLAQRDC